MSAPLRDAATVIVLRPSRVAFEVLLLRRHEKSPFMPGAYVFPGGTVDPGDFDESWAAHFSSVSLRERLGEPELAESTARSLFVAAIRETLEEANIRLLADPRLLQPWYRWITPTSEPRRFDTRFFLAQVTDHQTAKHDGIETTDGIWLSPRAALDRAGDLKLPPPTLRSLELLDEESALDRLWARTLERPPPVIEPIKWKEAEGPVIALPGDEAHPVDKPLAGEPTRIRWVGGRWRSR